MRGITNNILQTRKKAERERTWDLDDVIEQIIVFLEPPYLWTSVMLDNRMSLMFKVVSARVFLY